MAADWKTAYFLQARSDFQIFLLLNRHNAPLCHRLHYLQMMTEKLAKGFKTRKGRAPHATTHKAFVEFIKLAKGSPRIRQSFGYTHTEAWVGYVNSFMGLAQQIENLAPAGDVLDAPNPEYPWERQGQVIAPIEFDFINLNLQALKMIKLIDFIERCFQLIQVRE